MNTAEVLIVGAGPTGLVLALSLARQGVKPRIVDKNPGPGTASRAMAVQARTLELYRQLGLADEVAAGGIEMKRTVVHTRSREVARLEFGTAGERLSPYPFAVSFPQDDHERLLVEHLSNAGVEVEWGTDLVEFSDDGHAVRATLRRDGIREEVEVAYLAGCDGARSAVRQGLGIGFPGGTYQQLFYVADAEATGRATGGENVNACFTPNGFAIVFPIRSTGMHRLIGIVPEELEARESLSFEDVRPFFEKQIDVTVHKINWFSTYHVHHRVADNFRAGRVFLAGDAGHIHSPAGGQGMNTGIGDAINLAWKLAAVLSGRADRSLLDSYEPERIAFARTLVSTTDRVFRLIVGRSAVSRIARALIPYVAPLVMRIPRVSRAAFDLISQTRISYRESALSAGAAGAVQGGDRLPWVPGEEGDNFEPLASLDWQIHVYGEATPALRTTARALGLELHEFRWSGRAEAAGIARDALYLVRPDGYVALADAAQDARTLRAHLSRFKIAPREIHLSVDAGAPAGRL
jgi:2-polyprenyl-6-methoxyphenol hydroxylase-like FAD-dependent oxidoreductase